MLDIIKENLNDKEKESFQKHVDSFKRDWEKITGDRLRIPFKNLESEEEYIEKVGEMTKIYEILTSQLKKEQIELLDKLLHKEDEMKILYNDRAYKTRFPGWCFNMFVC